MNTRSAREYTMFAAAQLLRNWREQRPSSHGHLDSSVTESGPASGFHFCTIVRDCFWAVFKMVRFVYHTLFIFVLNSLLVS
jgi:hypothetical protein